MDRHVICWLPSPFLSGKFADNVEERDELRATAEPSAVFVDDEFDIVGSTYSSTFNNSLLLSELSEAF
jgi:hypothetical protein